MIGVVVPIHNQKDNIKMVMDGYLRQSKVPNYIIFVLDRCTDGSRHVISGYATDFLNLGCELVIVEKPEGAFGFSAGATRDYGIAMLLKTTNVTEFIFTDGDCVPHPRLVESHVAVLEKGSDKPTVACGSRLDMNEDGSYSYDPRVTRDYCKRLVFTEGVNRLVVNPRVVENSWACWSCNMSMNIKAIKLCMDLNERISGVRRVFNSQFDGKWGGEDGFVALAVFRSGGNVVMLDPNIHVTHIWHPRGHTNDSHLYVVEAMDIRLRSCILMNSEGIDNLQEPSEFHALMLPSPHRYDDLESLRKIVNYTVPENILNFINKYTTHLEKVTAAWFLARSYKHTSFYFEVEQLSAQQGRDMYDTVVAVLNDLQLTCVDFISGESMQLINDVDATGNIYAASNSFLGEGQ